MRLRSLLAVVAVAAAVGSLNAQDRHFMWKVDDHNGGVAYLLGSLHVLTKDMYPLAEPINKAFAESKTLVEEVNLDETSDPTLMMSALGKAMLTDGKTLEQIVAAPTYA
mgnify:CR=1 FL=1